MRSWKTDETGWIAIHASAQFSNHFQTETMQRYFYIPEDYRDSVTLGAIIGVVELVECVEKHRSAHFRQIEDKENTYGFVLANPIALPHPIPCKGQLKFWNVPDDIEKEMRKQLKSRWKEITQE